MPDKTVIIRDLAIVLNYSAEELLPDPRGHQDTEAWVCRIGPIPPGGHFAAFSMEGKARAGAAPTEAQAIAFYRRQLAKLWEQVQRGDIKKVFTLREVYDGN